MIVRCQDCQTRFHVPTDKIPQEGTLVRCSKCRSTFWVDKNSGTDEPDKPAPTNARKPGPDPSRDSWFDVAPIQQAENQKVDPSSTLPPRTKGKDPSRDSWFDVPKFEDIQAPLLKNEDGWEEKPPSTPAASDGPSLLSAALDATLVPTRQPPSSPAPNFTGEFDEDLAFSFEENEPESPFSNSILGPAVETTSRPSPSRPTPSSPKQSTPKIPAGPPPRIELFLTDRKQERRQLLYTITPLAIRGVLLFFMLVFSIWLWISLRQGDFTAKHLSFTSLQRVFFDTGSPWELREVRLHSLPIEKKFRLLIIRGKLHNKSKERQREPDLRLLSVHKKPTTLLKNIRCCSVFTPLQLHRVQNESELFRLYNLFQQKYPYRRWIEAGESRDFQILWILRKHTPRIKIKILANKKNTETAWNFPQPTPKN